jgi:hypothetical protein
MWKSCHSPSKRWSRGWWLWRHSSQHAKVDLKPLIVSVILIYSLSDTINLFCFLFFILINKLITFSAS